MSQYQGQQPQEGYGQQQAAPGQEYDDYANPPGVAPGPNPGPAGGRKKRRDYAGQAYEFGQGGNATGTPAGQQGGSISGFSMQQDAAGYPQGGYAQNPAAVQQSQTPMYGGQDAAVGGYQPPAPAYPSQPAQPGVAGVTQQFGQMDMSQKAQVPQQPQQQAQQPGRPPALNQLYPTDLQNQPLNVAELDYPPPPAILAPNVSLDFT